MQPARQPPVPSTSRGRAAVLRGALVCLVGAGTLWPAAPSGQQQPFATRVEVARVLIDVRVFGRDGRQVQDLEPADFAVEIGGVRVRVESAEWIGSPADTQSQPLADSPAPAAVPASPQPPGRLVVILVQKDLEPSRIVGLMQMGQMVDRLLAPLTSTDRVAVLSFDSRLRIWTDFTGDVDRVRAILADDVILRHPGPVSASRDVSLYARLGPESARGIFGIERALADIGEALEGLPGAKSIVILGYGFGRFNGNTGGVTLMDGYDEASATLQRARVAVFSLNVTRANFNSLQAGLQTVSAETGGLYASTYEFPARAFQRLADALTGHFVLFVEKPPALKAGAHRIEVTLTRRPGTVVARRSFVEAP